MYAELLSRVKMKPPSAPLPVQRRLGGCATVPASTVGVSTTHCCCRPAEKNSSACEVKGNFTAAAPHVTSSSPPPAHAVLRRRSLPVASPKLPEW